MRPILLFSLAGAMCGIGLSLGACSEEANLLGLDLGSASDAGPGSPGATPGACTNDPASEPAPSIEKLADPSTLPECTPACGGARCVPTAKVLAAARPMFAACSTGYCIPEALIKTGGAKPPACKSLGSTEGVCLSLCVPLVAANKDALPQATCAADERCAPCVNPQDNKLTGACDIGSQLTPPPRCESDGSAPLPRGDAAPGPAVCPYVGPPIIDPLTLPGCAGKNSGAHCLGTNHVPPAMISKLATCAGGYCVPDKLIASGGRFIPATCTSIAGAEGRCQNLVLPEVGSQVGLPTATCDPTEKCVPCFSPLDGSDLGACKTSCDPGPTKPAVLFANCCQRNGANRGKCAPRSSVPAAQASKLTVQSCGAAELCVPTENITPNFKATTCQGNSFLLGGNYSGVCVSDCVDFGSDGIALVRGNCDSVHTCAPCTRDGQPTGAPGCP